MGPVNDAKNIKKTLKGAGVRPFERPFANTFFFSADVDVYRYREQDIFLMTDEEGNKRTERWPSALNIVRVYSTVGCIPLVLTTLNL
jgi:hypothetical protein